MFALYRYSEADTLYNQTKALADKARERAKEAYKVALKLYTEATSIQLPAFDLDKLDDNTEKIKSSVRKEGVRLGDGGPVSAYAFPQENSTTDLSLYCLFSTFECNSSLGLIKIVTVEGSSSFKYFAIPQVNFTGSNCSACWVLI